MADRTPTPPAFLDRPIARVMALVVAVGCLGILGYLHRADLFPGFAPEAADDPFARCLAERASEIDGMLAEGMIDASRAELFKSRAEAMCRAQTQGEGSGPGLPNLPAQ